MKHVFISYKRDDFDFAESVKRCLEAAGIKVWRDDHIHAGEEWRNKIDLAIKDAFAMVVIMTPEAKASEYITYEWSFAVGREIRIIPLKYKATALHPRLEVYQYLDFTSKGNDNRPWTKLVAEIEEAQRMAQSAPETDAVSFMQRARIGVNGTDANTRKEAIATLAQTNMPEAREMLREALAHPVADVRQQATEALGEIKYQAAVPQLIELLQSETISGVRVAVIDALEVIKDARAIPAFLALLPRARANEKIRIVGALNSFGDASVVPVLLELYKQADVDLHEIIIHTVSNLDASVALPMLREALYDADLVVCTSAARALVKVGAEEAIDVLVNGFLMMSKSQCEVLAHTISAYQIDGIIVQLDDVYQKQRVVYRAGAEREKSAKIRRRIIWVIGLLKNKNSIATLLQSMDDEDVIVQRETIVAFKNICDERVLPALITILRWRFEDYDEKTLLCAVQAVGQIGNMNSVPHLQAVLETALDRYTELAVQIIQVIGAIGAYETIEYLKKVKNRLKREERYAPEKAQELIEIIDQSIGKMRSRIA